jgi:cytochrome P450
MPTQVEVELPPDGESGPATTGLKDTTLPPRPTLSRWTMATGFVLQPTKFLDACHERMGDYFTLRPAPGREIVVTADPEAVKRVFTGDPALLHAGEANIILAPLLGQRSVLLLDGPEHMRQRKLMLPSFHGERMKLYVRAMEEASEWHVAGWPRGRDFQVLPSMQAITLDVIMRAVFGVDDQTGRERLAAPLRRQLDMLSNRLTVLRLMLTARGGEPPGDSVRGAWAQVAALRREADELIYEQIRMRRRDPHAGERSDVFSMLLAARDEDGEPLSDVELRDELMTLLVAGHETTATAMAWTLERVVRHPDVLARLRDEPDGDYLDAVIKETLRLRPVVPAVARKLLEPMEFGGWLLPAGVHIAPSIYLIHRRPDLYPDPLSFKPERFLGKQPGTYEWIPFGGGIRRCLGASFALMEMKVVLSTIFKSVALEPIRQGAGARARARGRARGGDGGGESTMRRAVTFAPARGGRITVAA